MRSLRELLTELGELGVRVWPEGDRLRFSGPKDAVTAEMRAELQERKAELIEFLSLATRVKGESLSRITPLDRAEGQPLVSATMARHEWPREVCRQVERRHAAQLLSPRGLVRGQAITVGV